MSKNQIKKKYHANIHNFIVLASSIIDASNPIIKLLEIGNVDTANSLYKLVGDKIQIVIEDDERLQEKMLVRNAITAGLDYLKKIIESKELTSSDDNDLILSTNANVERVFGLMKSLEPTKFNLKKELFSALNCCKFNHSIEKLSARPDWQIILEKAINSTRENVEDILRAENMRETAKKDKLVEIEKLKDDEQRDLDRETNLFFMHPELFPKA